MLEQNQAHFGRRTETATSHRDLPTRINRSAPFVKTGVPQKGEPASQIRSPFYPNATASSAGKRDEHYQLVLQTLLGSLRTAIDCGRNPWDFAIELGELTNVGVSKHLLRVMVCDGVIEHRREITGMSHQERTFEPETDVVLTERSCFVLSDFGRRVFAPDTHHQEEIRMEYRLNGSQTNGQSTQGAADVAPVWDTKLRELRLGDIVVKRFKWPASNQEQILRAFQEEGWPAQIDDPLPPDPKICPKRRLHDTIKCLNRRQVNSAIKFRGDGTGQGVLLEIREDFDKDKNVNGNANTNGVSNVITNGSGIASTNGVSNMNTTSNGAGNLNLPTNGVRNMSTRPEVPKPSRMNGTPAVPSPSTTN